jgi:DNA-binding Xre family transcriptional regulator
MIKFNIKTLLEGRGESISDLQRGTGLSYQTCHALVHNQHGAVKLETLNALARYFGNISDIFIYIPDEQSEERSLTPGKQLKQWREELNLHQKQIAEQTGITEMSYSRIETGSIKKLKPEWLDALAKIFGERVRQLYM